MGDKFSTLTLGLKKLEGLGIKNKTEQPVKFAFHKSRPKAKRK